MQVGVLQPRCKATLLAHATRLALVGVLTEQRTRQGKRHREFARALRACKEQGVGHTVFARELFEPCFDGILSDNVAILHNALVIERMQS